MNILKKLLGIAPQVTKNGAFIPSKLSLKLATSDKTDFDRKNYENKYEGNKKIRLFRQICG